MKIRKMVPGFVEIGPLDHEERLPMARRIAGGMKTTCDACGKAITDEFFIGGFKAGQANLKLHESCAPSAEFASETEKKQYAASIVDALGELAK